MVDNYIEIQIHTLSCNWDISRYALQVQLRGPLLCIEHYTFRTDELWQAAHVVGTSRLSQDYYCKRYLPSCTDADSPFLRGLVLFDLLLPFFLRQPTG